MAQILCFGDSITQGFVDQEGGWTQRMARRLDREATVPVGPTTFPAHVTFNLGIAGETSAGLLARLEREVEPRLGGDQAIIVIAVGVNETASEGGEEQFAANLDALVRLATRHTDEVLLVGLLPCDEARMQPAPWGDCYTNERIRAFNDVVVRSAGEHGVALLDCFDELLARDHAALLHDGLHPNGDGHQLIADRVHDRIGPWL